MINGAGKIYAMAMAMRRSLYRHGWRKTCRPSVPCISVGNIAWGGTGKTPLTSWLLSFAEKSALKAVVLTRGYKGKPPHYPYLVRAESKPSQCGDEPLMLARAHPRADILVDPLRVRAAAWAERHLAPDLFILDDGFQHIAIQRDIDLLLLRPDDLGKDWNKVLSAWREGKKALTAADVFLLKCDADDFAFRRKAVAGRLASFGRPVYSFSLKAQNLQSLDGSVDDIKSNGDYILVSGVAGPEQVAATAEGLLGRAPLEHLIYPDHHAFSGRDMERISACADRHGAGMIVCTAKDAIKMNKPFDSRLRVLRVKVVFGPSFPEEMPSFEEWWRESWRQLAGRYL